MPTRQPASFNATFSRIAGSRAACLPLGGATREKAVFIVSHGPPRPRVFPRGLPRAFLGTGRRPLLQLARDGGAVDQGGQGSHPLDPSLLSQPREGLPDLGPLGLRNYELATVVTKVPAGPELGRLDAR